MKKPVVETVVYKGITFRRYPESTNRTDRLYFVPGGTDRKNGIGRLHEEVWKDANGPIPKGWHIHHKDEDTSHNEIDNLECLTAAAHLGKHLDDERRASLRATFKIAQAAAADWHGSPEGIAWHREHGKRTWIGREPIKCVCERCGNEYETLRPHTNRTCSNACKSALRRREGKDNVSKPCAVCGSVFKSNRFNKAQTCSPKCRTILGHGGSGLTV